MNSLSTLWGKPLLNDEEFSKLLEKDDDAAIWKALEDASMNDTTINRVFGLAHMRGWSRFRTVMVCSYVMAQRHERFIQQELDRLNSTVVPAPMRFCAKCSEDLFTTDDGGVTMRFKTPEERKA